MARYRVVDDITGHKENVIEWDGIAELGLAGKTVSPDDGEPIYVFVPVPELVTNYQARTVLIRAGMFEQADTAIRGSGDLEMVQAWDYANAFYRVSPFIAGMGSALGLSDEAIDDLFRQAALVS